MSEFGKDFCDLGLNWAQITTKLKKIYSELMELNVFSMIWVTLNGATFTSSILYNLHSIYADVPLWYCAIYTEWIYCYGFDMIRFTLSRSMFTSLFCMIYTVSICFITPLILCELHWMFVILRLSNVWFTLNQCRFTSLVFMVYTKSI